MSSSKNESVVDIYLHPLVLINISDHFTRIKVSNKNNPNPRVIGCLYGEQQGRKVEIKTSFEVVFKITDDDQNATIDEEFIKEKKEQYEQIFPNYEILGWYSTGQQLFPKDSNIQKCLMNFNDSPLYLLVPTILPKEMKDLPVQIYEGNVHKEDITFSNVSFKIETEESERIGIDYVNQVGTADANTSSVVPHLNSLHSAVEMLTDRVEIVIKYLEEVKNGNVQKNNKLLREISSLSHRLPVMDSPKFSKDYNNDLNETLMVTYLASITKGTNQLNDLVDKFNVAYEKRSRRGAMF